MITVYLVSKGSYSDYNVLGIYSTAEKAEQARIAFAADNEVQEFTLDAAPALPGNLLPWSVIMYGNGHVNVSRESAEGFSECSLRLKHFASDSGHYCSFRLWAEDEDHAVKIAADRRTALLAFPPEDTRHDHTD